MVNQGTCPCCGGKMNRVGVDVTDGFVSYRGDRVRLQPQRARIVDMLAKNPAGMTAERIADKLYEDDIDGGPLDPNRVVFVQVCQAKKGIQSLGLTIEKSAHRYVLRAAEVAA